MQKPNRKLGLGRHGERARFTPGYEVMNLKTHNSHGVFDSLEEAKGCVAYDRLTSWQIWHNSSDLVAERDMS